MSGPARKILIVGLLGAGQVGGYVMSRRWIAVFCAFSTSGVGGVRRAPPKISLAPDARHRTCLSLAAG